MEQQSCGTFQIIAFIEPQFLQQTVIIVHQVRFIHASTPFGIPTEQIKCGTIQVLRFQIRHRHTVPRFPLLAKHETIECSPFQFLIGRTASLVILPTKADRIRIGIRHNLQILPFVLFPQIDFHQDTHHIAYLIRDVLHQLLGFLYTAHFAIIAQTDIQRTALCVFILLEDS